MNVRIPLLSHSFFLHILSISGRSRTRNLLIRSQTLYPLSYRDLQNNYTVNYSPISLPHSHLHFLAGFVLCQLFHTIHLWLPPAFFRHPDSQKALHTPS